MANNYLYLQMEESPRFQGAPTTAPYRISTTGVFFPTTAGRVNANPSYIDRTNELRNIQGGVPDLIDTFAPDGAIAERCYVNHLAFLLSLSGLKATITPGDGATNIWTVAFGGTPSGGTFTLTVGGQTTAAIAWNAPAATVQAAVQALSTVGSGGVLVTGGPGPAAYVLTFAGPLSCLTQVVTATSSLTGTAPTVTPTSTQAAAAPTVQSPDWTTGDTFATKPGSFVGPGAFKYVFSKRLGAQAQTAQVTAAYGDMSVWLQGQGYGVSSLSLNATGELTTNLLGLVVGSVADPGFTPVLDSQSILPARRGDLTLTWLTGGGTIDDFTATLTNPLQVVRSLGLATPSLFPDVMEQGDTWPSLAGTIPKRRINGTDFAALINASTFAATARWRTVNYVAASPSKYGIWIAMPAVQLTGGTPDDLAGVRRFGASYNWAAQWDEASGYDFQVSLVCGVSAANLSSPFTI